MFGGGLIGNIASAALGVMGAFMGFKFAHGKFGNDCDDENPNIPMAPTSKQNKHTIPFRGETLTRTEHLAILDPRFHSATRGLAGVRHSHAGHGHLPVGITVRGNNCALQH
jgi:hypothetical protein